MLQYQIRYFELLTTHFFPSNFYKICFFVAENANENDSQGIHSNNKKWQLKMKILKKKRKKKKTQQRFL